MTDSSLRIVLGGGNLAGYLQGGGHWSAFLQYFHGLRALGHDVLWLETLHRQPGWQGRADGFFRQMSAAGFRDRCVLLVHEDDSIPTFDNSEVLGTTPVAGRRFCETADLLWNFVASFRAPLLDVFRRRVLVDLDPGILQISALDWDLGVQDHDVLLSVGARLGTPGCGVPDLGRSWHTFLPLVHCPGWPAQHALPEQPVLTSVTQWTWEESWYDGRRLSRSKRDAYLRFLDLPSRLPVPVVLAANIHPQDTTGDRELLQRAGWLLVDPHQVAGSIEDYRHFVRDSTAEISCVKPIYAELVTGWVSDRSAAYLACGRPVVMQSTGVESVLPTGSGLLTFSSLDEAVAAVEEVLDEYRRRCAAARDLAEEHLDTRVQLPRMLEACFAANGAPS